MRKKLTRVANGLCNFFSGKQSSGLIKIEHDLENQIHEMNNNNNNNSSSNNNNNNNNNSNNNNNRRDPPLPFL